MFDLEAAINVWRRQAASQGTGDRTALAELEDHLREEVATLARSGCAPEEAWRLAAAKLGDTTEIGREFAKIDPLPTLDRWALRVLVAATALIVGGLAVAMLGEARKPQATPVLTVHIATITLGYVLGLLAAIVAGYRTLRGLVTRSAVPALTGAAVRLVQVASLIAATCTVVGFVLGAVWANSHWGRPFSADPREIGALLVAASFIAAAITSFKGALSPRIPLTIAITGGGLVLAAWFGAIAHLHSYPVLSAVIGFGGFALSLALAALSLKVRHLSGPLSRG